MRRKVAGKLLLLLVERETVLEKRREEGCLRPWSLGQTEDKRLCPTRHSEAVSGVGGGHSEAQWGWPSTPHPSFSPDGQGRLLKPHSRPVAPEPHQPASY